MLESTAIAERSVTNSSKITNRYRRYRGVDGRTVVARRFRDLVAAYAKPLGGFAQLDEEGAALVRAVAAKTMESEALQAAIARGEPVDSEHSVRVANALVRLLAELRALHKPPAAPTLADAMAEAAAARKAREEAVGRQVIEGQVMDPATVAPMSLREAAEAYARMLDPHHVDQEASNQNASRGRSGVSR